MMTCMWPRNLLLLALLLCGAQASAENLFRSEDYRPLTADRRASRPGDIVTILVYENSSARNSTDTSTSTGFNVGGSVNSLAIPKPRCRPACATATADAGRYSAAATCWPRSAYRWWNSCRTTISWSRANRTIDINGEKTRIRLSGRIRPTDISQGNTLLSTRIADARIDYVGDGYISDRTRPGLIPRVLAWLGLW